VDVANVGTRPGKEVVQLYLRDPVASAVVPVQRLVGVEPGAFEVAVGSSSPKLHLTGRFEVLP